MSANLVPIVASVEYIDRGPGLTALALSTNVGLHLELTALRENNPARSIYPSAWAVSLSSCCGTHTVNGTCISCHAVAPELTFNLVKDFQLEEEKRSILEGILASSMDPLQASLVSPHFLDIIGHFLATGPWDETDSLPTTPLLEAHAIIKGRSSAR